jgi:predicted RNA-binding protein YlqC (UPF0109 family)
MSDAAADPLVPFIRELLVKLVDHPEQVEVRVEAGHPTLYEARVAPDDIGQVVGREGRIVKALRTLVSSAAMKRGERATFEIAEPGA